MNTNKNNLVQLDVIIDRLIFKSRDNDFAIYECELIHDIEKENKSFDLIKIQGEFVNQYFPGESYIMYGQEYIHAKYGKSYKVSFVENKFDSPERVKAFLETMVATSISNQLINLYGGAVLDKIINDEVDYSKISGMGEIRFQSLKEKVIENKYMKELIVGLSEFGISPSQMKKIAVLFGPDAVDKIKDNPYMLCQVNGIGFKKADSIAERMGYDMQSPNRIKEAVRYIIEEEQSNGHSWIEKTELFSKVEELLGFYIDFAFLTENEIQGVKFIEGMATTDNVYMYESFIYEKLTQMNFTDNVIQFDMDEFLDRKQNEMGMILTEDQKSFFYSFQKSNVCFLIGFAGTGKSQLTKILSDLVDEMHKTMLLLCPTGKAAKVLESYVHRPASTIHRALKIYENGRQVQVEIWDDVVLVDENSMASVDTMYSVLKAIRNPSTKVVFQGDPFQLPSVGVGAFLHDCVEYGNFPVTKLTKVFRQEDGGILDVATNVRSKEKFISNSADGKQEYGKDMVIHCARQEFLDDGYKYYLKDALKKYSLDDVVILSPTKKGNLGTVAINNEIQSIVNPPSSHKNELKHGLYTVFREGDRIINVKNTYRVIAEDGTYVDIMNGDMGKIYKINHEEKVICIDYGFTSVSVKFDSLDALQHAYALTVHKSQGSGFPYVIMIADKAHKWQLNANLLYTAITRSKERCVILCQADVINSSMNKIESVKRNTFLKLFLNGSLRVDLDKSKIL